MTSKGLTQMFCLTVAHLDVLKDFLAIQPILAKKIYDIYKFQIFKKITIFHNVLNIKPRLCLDCIRHFQRDLTRLYCLGHRKLAS